MHDLQAITAPLKKMDVSGFCYSKFKNGVRIVELINIPNYVDLYLSKLDIYPKDSFFENYHHQLHTGFNIYPFHLGNLSKNSIYQDMKDNGMEIAICFTFLSDDKSEIERFNFSFKKIETLITKLNDLKSFINFNYYFKEKANKIISQSIIKNKIFIPDKKIFLPNTTDIENTNTKLLVIDKYYFDFLPEGEYLTKREFEILKLYYLGDTAKTISIKLNTAHRTIETHLQKIRKKAQTNNLLKTIKNSFSAVTLLMSSIND